MVENEVYQIVSSVTDKGSLVSNPNVTYVSSDISIATVDNKGIVTALKQGTCTITASIGNVNATLILTITPKVATHTISYSCNWSTGQTSNGVALKVYVSSTATCKKILDGNTDTSLLANYTLDSVGSSLLANNSITITRKSNTEFLMKNVSVNTSKSFTLTFADSVDNSIIATQTVNLSGM